MLGTLVEREKLTTLNYLGGGLALGLGSLLCLWAAARLFWQLMPGEPMTAGISHPSSGTAIIGAPGTTPMIDLANLSLFGRSGPAALQSVTFDAPETSLDLHLQGTLAADDPKSGLAIIADDQGREAFYGVGDDLPGGASQHEKHAERVILVRQGKYESLKLRDPDSSAQLPAGGRRGRQTAVPGTMTPTAQHGGIKGLDWAALQQQQRLDPTELAKQIQVLPFTQNGKQVGVRLQAGRDAVLMNRLGLRSTDVITSVNGIDLNDPGKAFELIRQLNSETQFNVVLLRDGRETTLNINLNQ
jgi:general secretion pathway protein C